MAPTMIREEDAGPVLDFAHGNDAGKLRVLPAAVTGETAALSASHAWEQAVGMAREMTVQEVLVRAHGHDVRDRGVACVDEVDRGVAAPVVNELAQEGAVEAAAIAAAAEEGIDAEPRSLPVVSVGASPRRDKQTRVAPPGWMRRRKPCIGYEQGPQGSP